MPTASPNWLARRLRDQVTTLADVSAARLGQPAAIAAVLARVINNLPDVNTVVGQAPFPDV